MTKVSVGLVSPEVSLLGPPRAAFLCPHVAFLLCAGLPAASWVSTSHLIRALVKLD